MATTEQPARFPSPFEVATPPGCEGWEELYPYYYVFSEDRREFEEEKFWFFDGLHHPAPIYPFDTITCESWWVPLSQYTSRVFMIPPALGIDQRVVNGYLYLSPNAVTDPKVIEERAAYFAPRAGYYFEHWDELYDQWQRKAEAHIKALTEIPINDLPEIEDESVVTEGRGITSGYYLIEAYNRLIENMLQMWNYHFEMLNLGYVAYLTFMDFCTKAFPGISDQTISRMVAGIDVLLFRPDDELKKLARLALDLGVADVLKGGGDPDAQLARLATTDAGRKWLEALEEAKDPWFNFSSGTGFYHNDRSWVDDLSIPFAAIDAYIGKLEAGETIDRPLETVLAERERISAEYGELLQTEEDRKTFAELLGLARTVFPYVENHNFYVEHWHGTIFWRRMRELAAIFVRHGFFAEADDLFFLHRSEIPGALYDLVSAWAVGTPARGPRYWPREVARRRAIFEKLREFSPPPALGTPPEVITEPFTVMLWGVTTETVQNWLAPGGTSGDAAELKGHAGSPGVVEGLARVIRGADQLSEVQAGEILVCPTTAPSWAPIFSKIGATVSDIGGIMCHAAIVCREYGLPAVVGTGFATKVIKTGQRVRVDGNTGLVTILDADV